MYRIARTFAVTTLLLGGPAALAQDIAADTVLAQVNGTAITAGNMIALVQNLPEQYLALPDEVLFSGLLDQMIQQALMSQSLTDPNRAERLRIENQAVAVAASLAIERVLATAVTEEALQAAYTARFLGAEPELEYNASHILVPTEDEAKAIVAELRAGADFAELARTRSQDPGSGANGGLLGWFGRGMMVKPFEDAVVAAEVGKPSDPVQSDFGWHIVLVHETRAQAAPPLDAVRAELEQQLRDEAVQKAITDATAAATVVRTEFPALDPSFLRNTALLEE